MTKNKYCNPKAKNKKIGCFDLNQLKKMTQYTDISVKNKSAKNLYEEICKKSEKLSLPSDLNEVDPSPEWYCISCKTRYKQWRFVCNECGAVNSLKWPKTENTIKKKFFLENPFRHFPKM